MTVRAVLFDWGGVIQRTASAAPRLALDAELGLSPGSVERAVFASEVWQQASTGGCDGDSAWEDFAAQLGWPAERLDELVIRFFQGDVVDEELVTLIRRLRAAGLKVGLLSNAPLPRERAGSAAAAGRWGMDACSTPRCSLASGRPKPDPRTYLAALAALDVDRARPFLSTMCRPRIGARAWPRRDPVPCTAPLRRELPAGLPAERDESSRKAMIYAVEQIKCR
jgi:FMN phosphatase YigB (HAD superfamily)